MKTIKRSLSLLLSIVLVISVFTIIPMTTASAAGVEIGKWVKGDYQGENNGSVYRFTDLYENVIFCRVNSAHIDDFDSLTNKWAGDVVWNQTANLTLNGNTCWLYGFSSGQVSAAWSNESGRDDAIYAVAQNGVQTDAVIYAWTFETFELTEHAAVNHTATTDGNVKYFTSGDRYFVEDESAVGGYRQVTAEDIVVPATGVASIGENKYLSFADAAAAAAQSGDTITLNTDIEEAYTLSACEALNVYKNGYNLTVNAPEDHTLFTHEESGVTTYASIYCSVSLSLKDAIDINFYVKDLPSNCDPADYTVKYTFDEVETTVQCSSVESNRFVVASCSAKQMGDIVHIEVFGPYDNDASIKALDYSIKTYCEANIAGETSLANLCNATLVYGAAAQKVFDYKTDSPVAENYDLSNVSIPNDHQMETSGNCSSSVSKISTSLVLRDKTELNFYITPESGKDVSVYVDNNLITLNSTGNITLTELEDGRLRLKIAGISAKDLEDTYTIAIGSGEDIRTITYSPLSYAYASQNSEKMGEISKALYRYYQEAKTALG